MLTKDSIIPQNYNLLLEEIKGTIDDAVFHSRQELINGYWNVGKLLRESGGEITKLTARVAVDLRISERNLWNAIKCFDKYPDLSKLPEGKNISWNKLITKYLPEKKEEIKKEVYKEYQCPMCKFVGGLEDFEK